MLGVGSNSMKRLQEVARETKDGRKFTKIAAKRETKGAISHFALLRVRVCEFVCARVWFVVRCVCGVWCV